MSTAEDTAEFTQEQRGEILSYLAHWWDHPESADDDMAKKCTAIGLRVWRATKDPNRATREQCLAAALWGFQAGYMLKDDPEFAIHPEQRLRVVK